MGSRMSACLHLPARLQIARDPANGARAHLIGFVGESIWLHDLISHGSGLQAPGAGTRQKSY